MKQEEESDDRMTRFSEMTTSSSMYTTRRLRLLSQLRDVWTGRLSRKQRATGYEFLSAALSLSDPRENFLGIVSNSVGMVECGDFLAALRADEDDLVAGRRRPEFRLRPTQPDPC